MTRIDLGLLAASAAYLVSGYAVLFALGLARPRARDLRLVGLAYLLGFAALGIALTLALLAGIGPSVAAVVVATAGIAVLGLVVGRRRGPRDSAPARRAPSAHPLAVCAAVGGAAVLVVACASAFAVSLTGVAYAGYWDVVEFWLPKAQSIYFRGAIDADVWRAVRHPEYPPLQPVLDAATFHLTGGFHASLLPFQRTLLGIAFLLAALALLDAYVPRWLSLPTLALLATTPWFWWRLQTPLADQPLAYLVAIAAVALVIWLYEPRTDWLVLALVLLTAGTLTKLEGALFALPLVLAVIAAGLVLHGRAALPALVLLLAPAAILPWRLWLRLNDLPASSGDYVLTDMVDPGFLADRTSRLGTALETLLGEPFRQPQTTVLVVGCVLALVVVALRMPAIAAAVAAWLVLSVAGLATIFWIGRLEIGWYLSTAASRVGATVIVAAAAVTPLLLGLALQQRRGDPS